VTRAGEALLLLSCICLVACGNQTAEPSAAVEESDESIRIVTLSPHLAELVFAVGAGNLVVGVSAYTDYPDQAATLPIIGDAFNLDQERLALLSPDLLLAWDTGTPVHVVDELRRSGYRVEVITTTKIADVAAALRRIGELTGRSGDAAARNFATGIEALAARYRTASGISVFYQVDTRPLYTINGRHFVSELIGLCGGTNIFADLDGLAPLVSVEAVLERDPEVMLASSDAGPAAFDEWDRWADLSATRYGNRFLMPADEIGRPTPRLLQAAEAVCEALDTARRNREAHTHD
jgi:iron complex transport system substrate-binding protein